MPSGPGEREFERALSAEAYSAAWRYCCRLSACREDAEDLLQDALARAYLHFHQLRHSASFKAWLLAIVRRCHLMRLRSARRRPLVTDAASAPGSDDAGGTAERDVWAALSKLPEAQRQLLILVYMEELAPREAARVLGISPAAARQRLLRARRALRAHLESDQPIAPDGLPRSTRS